MPARNIFADAVGTEPPPSMMEVKQDHPVPRKGIMQQAPLQTNKFYSNFFLAEQRAPTYTFPYSITWGGGTGVTKTWGMVCSHIEAHQRVFGEEKFFASSYYLNPVGIESLALSARELGNDTTVSMDSITAFSSRVHLSTSRVTLPIVSFSLAQGMPYLTSVYHGATPLIQTGVFFRSVTKFSKDLKRNLSKFTIVLEDGATWRLYAWATEGEGLDLDVMNNGMAVSRKPFSGVLQIAKDPMTPGSEQALDDGAGIYPVSLELTGSTAGKKGWYQFHFQTSGHETGNLYMYALPHHVESFDRETAEQLQRIQLQTPTKGVANLVRGDTWTMVEPEMPVGLEFAPWHPMNGTVKEISDEAKVLIRAAATRELGSDVATEGEMESMYFGGKALAKFALLVYVASDLLKDQAMAQSGLEKLKKVFGIFAANEQKHPLCYDSAWGGVVSSATYTTGDLLIDFGNTLYNDHHFHYGYHILAAAIIGHLDGDWVKENRDYVNSLVRDVANPSQDDKYFPMWRNFDWYHGHSWAHGLFASADGKNQESSSEDMMHAYALKMWGHVSGDESLEA
ncbi:endo-1,3(4)-beta-glucanase, partial [Geosmithia morbida]